MRQTYALAGELLYLLRKELGFGALALTVEDFPSIRFEWRVKKNDLWWVCNRAFRSEILDPETLESFARHLAMEMKESCRKS